MRAERDALVINGGQGEGGGALFRTALAMSALTHTPVRIHQIRAATRKPGISSEDLTFIRMLEASCSGRLEGDALDSNELLFVPKHAPKALRGEFDVQSFEKGVIPGNALMLAESVWPVLARAGAYSSFLIKGETYNNHTLTFDAFAHATLLLHARQGVVGFAAQKMAGFGFGGQGEVQFEVEPSAPNGLDWLKRGDLRSLRAIISHHGVSKEAPERGMDELRAILGSEVPELEIELNQVDSRENGIHVTLIAEYEFGIGVGSCLGAKGVKVESVCRAAHSALKEFTDSTATLDPFLADQALVCAALAQEPTQFVTQRITPRLQTMAYIIRQFIPIPITILGRLNDVGTVKIGQ